MSFLDKFLDTICCRGRGKDERPPPSIQPLSKSPSERGNENFIDSEIESEMSQFTEESNLGDEESLGLHEFRPESMDKKKGLLKKQIRKGWTPADDRLLTNAVTKHGKSNWKQISREVNGHTSTQCQRRWLRLNPAKRRVWTKQEDEKVKELVATMGPVWLEIAMKLDGRTGKQVRDRYLNILDPDIKKGNWTPDEDAKILKYHMEFGAKWAEIARQIPGRSENMVKNRYYAHIRRRFISEPGANDSSEAEQSSPVPSGAQTGLSASSHPTITVNTINTTINLTINAMIIDGTNSNSNNEGMELETPNINSPFPTDSPGPGRQTHFNFFPGATLNPSGFKPGYEKKFSLGEVSEVSSIAHIPLALDAINSINIVNPPPQVHQHATPLVLSQPKMMKISNDSMKGSNETVSRFMKMSSHSSNAHNPHWNSGNHIKIHELHDYGSHHSVHTEASDGQLTNANQIINSLLEELQLDDKTRELLLSYPVNNVSIPAQETNQKEGMTTSTKRTRLDDLKQKEQTIMYLLEYIRNNREGDDGGGGGPFVIDAMGDSGKMNLEDNNK